MEIPTIEPPQILKDPLLWNKVMKELDKKIVGEEDTRMAIFFSLCSVWVKNKQGMLNICVNSESSAGKSYVCQKIVEFFPDKLIIYRTKITPEVLTYWHNKIDEPDWTWDGKILYLEDIRQNILDSDALKVMVSEGSIATILQPKTLRPRDIEIRGKPLIMVTTVNPSVKTEILNRFSLVNLDEEMAQTINIQFKQVELAETGEGNESYDEEIKNTLKFLEPVKVKIPYASHLMGYVPVKDVRMRRVLPILLDLIKASAAFHQHQRKRDGAYVIANEVDYEIMRRAVKKMETMKSPLTHKHKRALRACQKLTGWFTTKDVITKDPFVGLKTWYNYLSHLQMAGYLDAQQMPTETSSKLAVHYQIKDNLLSFNLPDYNTFANSVSDYDYGEILTREVVE